MLIFRKARHEDKSAIIDISKDVWEGTDYLPDTFDKWVEEKGGEFTVAELDGRVVGCAKFSLLSPGEYWLEGIRVHRDMRGQGIAKKITEYYIDKAKSLGYEYLSLSTYIENYGSIKIIKDYRFEPTLELMGFYADENTQVEDVTDYQMVNDIVEVRHIFDTEEMKKRKKFLAFDWTFMKAKEELIKELVDRGEVYILKDGDVVKSTIILSDKLSKSNELSISYLDGKDYYKEAMKFAIKKTIEGKYQGLEFMCPKDDNMRTSAFEAGLKTWDEHGDNVFIYEYMG